LVTVSGRGVATGLVGLLPTAASAGLIAPVLLLLIRLAQGFFAGGEVTGAAAYVAESAPRGQRGFYGAVTPVGVAIGGALAATVCGLSSFILGAEQMQAWGWRIPFLMAIPMVIVSSMVRRRV
ncbi:MFS transporter, partial [Chromohalobacter sp. HP20-39]|uniref:MFS transporter n=1 Tax=Chromohalobacter sp. HP20-39 TaxID=3079306 RepID=UPI00294ADB1A